MSRATDAVHAVSTASLSRVGAPTCEQMRGGPHGAGADSATP